MSTWIRKVVTATATILALALLLPAPASAQSPANCNANLLDETISRSTATAGAGDIVTYGVTATDRSLNPPACTPGVPPCQVGCDIVVTTASFCCPDATGNPPTPPSPLCTTLVTNLSVPAQDNTVVFGICAVSGVICRFQPTDCPGPGDSCGPFPCTMPNIVGDATSGVFGNGTLNDGFDSPFEIDKTIAVAITTTTTTTSTSTSTSSTTSSTTTTTVPALCLSRTPGF